MPSDAGKTSRQDQAAAWFAAERAGMMLVEQRAEFDAWLADPRNKAALDAMKDLWQGLSVLKGNEPAPTKAQKPKSRAPIVAAVAAVLLCGIAMTVLVTRPGPHAIITADGQQRTETMPDGSVLAVNVASNVSYRFTDSQRVVTLESGEAAFSVKPDPAKPFVVRVGDFEVRAIGTSFNVRERGTEIQVAVSEGKVELCRMTPSGEQQTVAYLGAGEMMTLPGLKAAPLNAITAVAVPPSNVSEWRMRVVTYEGATVKDVVDDLNRYFAEDVQIEEQPLLDQRITIRLRVDNRERAIETLAGLLDAKVIRVEGRDVLRR